MKSFLSINSKELFKLVLICCTGFYVPIGLLLGLLAGFDIVPTTLNGQQYIGLKGFAIGIIFIPVSITILTLSQWLVLALGLKLAKIGLSIYYRLSKK